MARLESLRTTIDPRGKVRHIRQLTSVMMAATLASLLLGCEPEHQLEQVQVLSVGSQRSIVCHVNRDWECTQPWYYEVRERGRVIVPATVFAFWIPRPGLPLPVLHTVRSSDGMVAGVSEEQTPERILILHDFGSGFSWPRDDDDPRKLDNALRVLRDAHPALDFVLTSSFARDGKTE